MIEKQNRVVGKQAGESSWMSIDPIPKGFARKSWHYLTRATGDSRKGVPGLMLLLAVGVCVVGISLVQSQHAASAEVDATSVQRSIDRGVAYLRKTQSDRGGWEEFSGQSCGASSLCTLALLNSGVSRDDPDLTRAMRYLRNIEPSETYSVSLQTLVYCQLGAAGDLPRIRRNVQVLVREQVKDGAFAKRSGAWGYGGDRLGGDPSNTQFALLALGAAQDRGIEVDSAVFERSLKYWLSRQNPKGGWGYGGGTSASGSMTCAGIASVIIAQGRLSKGSSQITGDQIRCCGGADADDDPVQKGVDWLTDSFSVTVNPGGHLGTYFYFLYALERVGRLSGRRFIGDHDWYREGAEQLLDQQDNFQGFWAGGGWEEDRNITTAFALLFLSKGKRQVVIGQFQHGDGKSRNWQQHPDGMRQLVRHVEKAWRRDLTWQTIQGKDASVADLLQTPVLVISDSQSLQLTNEALERLKQYIDQGGTILFEADGGDGCGDASAFEKNVNEICRQWFGGTTLAKLPPTHPVWFAERKVDIGGIDAGVMGDDFWVYGVQACCRTSVFYVPRSLSCRWELSDLLMRRNEVSASVTGQLDTSVRIGQNIIAYATGRELKDKLDKRVVLDSGPSIKSDRGTVRLAYLSLDAGGEEARRALPNAAAIIGKRAFVRLAPSPEPVSFDADELKDVFVLWIHGRTEFQFTIQQREVLREYVQNDGVIIASAICGNEAFAASFREEIKRILPGSPLLKMPPEHPAFTPSFDGDDVRRVTVRKPVLGGGGQSINRRQSHPVLEYAEIDGVANVFFSPLDLSCALESSNSVQCPGYDTKTAAQIVGNLVLFALQQ
ncbi:DUF4159 domain-containing protein [Stieleria marina]|uniref:DUF4159 domain-containing protein n=1 Tax=Stieleria marina TaxID=1930275 RepID=A0A517NPK9_9BACT|nr:hypothetical protein K239x_10080 [Planctomycetes bacterium K23_9]